MDKICSKCGETKDISLFAKDRILLMDILVDVKTAEIK